VHLLLLLLLLKIFHSQLVEVFLAFHSFEYSAAGLQDAAETDKDGVNPGVAD